MNLKSLNLSVVAATLFSGALCVAPEAKAFRIITSVDSFTNQTTELTGTPLLTLGRFGDALIANSTFLGPNEALTRVQIDTAGSLTSSGTVTNNAPNPQTFDVVTSGRLRLTKGGGAPASITSPYNPIPTATLIGDQTFTNLAGGGTSDIFTAKTVSGSTTQSITAIAQLVEFLGLGTFTFAPTTLIGTTIFGGGGNVATTISTFADANVTITYTIEVVPFEFNPAIGIGILGLAWGANKLRKAKKASSN